MDDSNKVRCAECGYLAIRDIRTWRLVEAEQQMRQVWSLPIDPVTGKNIFADLPVCFVGAAQLDDEIGEYREYEPPKVLAVINANRKCEAATPWKHGLTPAEHMALIKEETKRKSDRKWQLVMAAAAAGFTLLGALVNHLLSPNRQPQPQPIIIQVPAEQKTP